MDKSNGRTCPTAARARRVPGGGPHAPWGEQKFGCPGGRYNTHRAKHTGRVYPLESRDTYLPVFGKSESILFVNLLAHRDDDDDDDYDNINNNQ